MTELGVSVHDALAACRGALHEEPSTELFEHLRAVFAAATPGTPAGRHLAELARQIDQHLPTGANRADTRRRRKLWLGLLKLLRSSLHRPLSFPSVEHGYAPGQRTWLAHADAGFRAGRGGVGLVLVPPGLPRSASCFSFEIEATGPTEAELRAARYALATAGAMGARSVRLVTDCRAVLLHYLNPAHVPAELAHLRVDQYPRALNAQADRLAGRAFESASSSQTNQTFSPGPL